MLFLTLGLSCRLKLKTLIKEKAYPNEKLRRFCRIIRVWKSGKAQIFDKREDLVSCNGQMISPESTKIQPNKALKNTLLGK